LKAPRLSLAVRRSPVIGVVSHLLPPGASGYAAMLEELLRDVPAEKIALVGNSDARWGDRATVRVPNRYWVPAISAALANAPAKNLVARALSARFPNVRRVFTTLDPTMVIAAEWARVAGAELWIYGIDLHARTFWRRARFLEPSYQRWVEGALSSADACFALSHRMAEWMQAAGARGAVEVLPPLIDVGPARPLPEGAPSFVYSGWIYSANAPGLKWVESAVGRVAPSASLRLVTRSTPRDVERWGLDPARWSIQRAATNEQVIEEVARATWTIASLDPQFPDREALKVAWPTKLREYLAVGRPVLCVASADYAAAEIARDGGWGIVASTETETREAVERAVSEPRDELLRRAAAARAFAIEKLDSRTVGARWRARLLA
jgi:hypothetical protein